MRRKTFSRWWASMNKASREKQNINFHKWLKFACITVAHRGNQDQQRVVYTIFNRYDRSEHRRITKRNAQRVYKIINTKTDDVKQIAKKPEVQIVKRRTVKTITGAGKGRQKTDRPGITNPK